MESIVMILVLIASLVALDVTSFFWGADSRPGMTDDHAR